MRVKKAAEYLSLSPNQIRSLIQRGVLPVVITGNGQVPWLLDVRDLDHWIELHKQRLAN